MKTTPAELNRVDALHFMADGGMVVLMPHGMNPIRFSVDGFERWTPTLGGWSPCPLTIFNKYRTRFYAFVEQCPHRKGSFGWAQWHFGRGRTVWRESWPNIRYDPDPIDRHAFEGFLFRAEDFHAEDWTYESANATE